MEPMPLMQQLRHLEAFCEQLPQDVQREVRARFLAGRGKYGDAWATRDNLAEALPEIADAIAYIFMHSMAAHASQQTAIQPLVEAWRAIKEAQAK